jgi:Protein of unknown function (DUF2795)
MVEKSTLDTCLQGISFPADGKTIVETAGYNSCPSDVLSKISDTPGYTFESEEELLCDLGNSTYC